MPNRNPVLLKKTLLAIAVASLSACSNAPRVPDYDLSPIGAGILSAGRTTADVSQKAWNKTTYLLGFSDGDTVSDDSLLMDEVDLALLEEDAVLPNDTELRPVVIRNAIPSADPVEIRTPTNDVLASQTQNQTPTNESSDSKIVQITTDDDLIEDLIHEVASAETLWDISKMTTGDANNWHVLADVNDLGPNAAVYPGQELVIPGSMLKPDYDSLSSDQSLATAETEIPANTQDLNATPDASVSVVAEADADSLRLQIPEESEIPDGQVDSLIVGTAFEIQSGETLWDFSKRVTGDATNWKAIAGQNNFSERQAVLVRAGQKIYVPDELVKSDSDIAKAAIQTPTNPEQTTTLAAATPDTTTPDMEAIDASSDLLADAAVSMDETQPLKIVEATFKADETVQPVTAAQPAAVAESMSLPNEIMVSGTYYPKAIYNSADFSSSLLMRVSPGTKLQVSNAIGNWFEVETNKGVGYVHQRDIK